MNTRFKLKRNVPDVFIYPFTRKEVKNLATKIPAINEISYIGVSPHDRVNDTSKGIWLGHVVGNKTESEWNFSLALYASRGETLSPVLDQVKDMLLHDATNWIRTQLKQPESYPDGSNTIYLSVVISNGTVKSSSVEQTKTNWK